MSLLTDEVLSAYSRPGLKKTSTLSSRHLPSSDASLSPDLYQGDIILTE